MAPPVSLPVLPAAVRNKGPSASPALVVSEAPGAGGARPALDPRIVARLERLGEAAGEDLMSQLSVLFLATAYERMEALRRALAGNDTAGMVSVTFAANACPWKSP